MIKLYTIGFAGKTAERFFSLLRENGVRKIIDARLHPSSQLSGFAKAKDLEFFAREIAGIGYEHKLEFAPTEDLLTKYRSKSISWQQYEAEYLHLLEDRQVMKSLQVSEIEHACLLCSEHDPGRCHRKVLAQYIAEVRQDVSVVHLI